MGLCSSWNPLPGLFLHPLAPGSFLHFPDELYCIPTFLSSSQLFSDFFFLHFTLLRTLLLHWAHVGESRTSFLFQGQLIRNLNSPLPYCLTF